MRAQRTGYVGIGLCPLTWLEEPQSSAATVPTQPSWPTLMACDTSQVTLSGAVEGKAVWPKKLTPVAWHKDADRVRMKLGLYHKVDQVHDGMVEYRDISIQGPNGKFRPTGLRNRFSHGWVSSWRSSLRSPSEMGWLALETVTGNVVAGCTWSDQNNRVLEQSMYFLPHSFLADTLRTQWHVMRI